MLPLDLRMRGSLARITGVVAGGKTTDINLMEGVAEFKKVEIVECGQEVGSLWMKMVGWYLLMRRLRRMS